MATTLKHDVLGEFSDLILPDKRLVDRVLKFVTAASMAPAESFPDMLEDVAGLEGAYRLLSNKRVTFDALHEPHKARVAERGRQAGSVVVAHDTSDVKTPWAEAAEVGYLNTGEAGYRAHVSLALSIESDRPVRPLGALCVQPIFRPKPSKSNSKHASGAQTARWKDKEYVRWERGVEQSARALADCPSVVHVMDREADCYPLFSQIQQLNQGFVIRLRSDRRAKQADIDDVDDEDWSTLGKLATEMKGVCVRDVPLSKRGAKQAPASLQTHPPRESRNALLHFGSMQVEIAKPRHVTNAPASLSLSFIRVWEPNPPEGEEPVEWMLITNEPCETPEEIVRVVDLYRCRWIIEEFFKALKTGCALEKRQLESRRALLNMLALFLPIAVHLLWMRSCARDTPDAPATDVFTPVQLTVLRHRSHRRMSDNPTAREALWVLAGIGGHIPNNGWPGWQILARAYVKLLEAVEVWKLATAVAAGSVGAQKM
jgi:Transposase DNA-binding/Transposase DDE domain